MKKKGNLLKVLAALLFLFIGLTVMSTSTYAETASASKVLVTSAKISGKKAVKLSWNKVSGANKYVVYGAAYGKKATKLATVKKGSSFKVSKIGKKALASNKVYTFYVVAYKNSKKIVKSDKINFITNNSFGKYANVTKIKASQSSISLKQGDSTTITVKKTIYKKKKHLPKKYGAATRYYSDNKSVATVSSKGKVTAVAPGTANIYVQDNGGKYCKVSVTVSPKEFTVTFDTNGGSKIAPIIVLNGGKVTKPATPKCDPYLFENWYKDKNHTTVWNFDKDVVTSDVTIYANWYEPLAFRTGGSTEFQLKKNGDAPNINLSVSYDEGKTWTDLGVVNSSKTFTLRNSGSSVLFKGNNPNGFNNGKGYWSFTSNATNGSVACAGNVMALIDPTCRSVTIPNDYCFCHLFENFGVLSSGPKIPATSLKTYCYAYMFQNCRSLKETPKLPATTLEESCYENMFSNCTSLYHAEDLKAAVAPKECYYEMFKGCSALYDVGSIDAVSFGERSCGYMFSGCTMLTKFSNIKNNATLGDYCFQNMFEGCSKLASAPALPSTALKQGCYSYMFKDCVKLETAPSLPATTLAQGCYCGMFSGCSILTQAPALPAEILVRDCYKEMFLNCSSLKKLYISAKEGYDIIGSVRDMLKNVSGSGKIYYIPQSERTRFQGMVSSNWELYYFD